MLREGQKWIASDGKVDRKPHTFSDLHERPLKVFFDEAEIVVGTDDGLAFAGETEAFRPAKAIPRLLAPTRGHKAPPAVGLPSKVPTSSREVRLCDQERAHELPNGCGFKVDHRAASLSLVNVPAFSYGRQSDGEAGATAPSVSYLKWGKRGCL